jgi:hypothetical protein
MGEMINTLMYLDNKYTKWYYSIITNASIRKENLGYVEKHHIIPRSLGGSKTSKNNIVCLTPKEHFICHLLLTKMVKGQQQYKMLKALTMLMGVKNIGKGRYIACGRWYSYVRHENKKNVDIFWTEERRKAHSDKLKLYNEMLNKDSEKEINRRKLISESQKNKTWTEKAIINRTENMKKSAERRKGKPWSENRRKSYENNPYIQPESANKIRSEKLKGRKTSVGNTGKIQSDITKWNKMVSNPKTLIAWFLSPSNEEIFVVGLNRFSDQQGLNVGSVRAMVGNTDKLYKGWKFLRFATEEERMAQNY